MILLRFDEVAIRGEIQKSQNKRNANQITVKTKSIQEVTKDKQNEKPIKKEENTINPHLAKTEKRPSVKAFLKNAREFGSGY